MNTDFHLFSFIMGMVCSLIPILVFSMLNKMFIKKKKKHDLSNIIQIILKAKEGLNKANNSMTELNDIMEKLENA